MMTRDVVTVDGDDTLVSLIRSLRSLRFRHLPVADDDRLIGLLERRFGCLPVVDDQNVLRGVVTSSDFVRLVVKAKHEADG
jgi:CBS domain-containing protein